MLSTISLTVFGIFNVYSWELYLTGYKCKVINEI